MKNAALCLVSSMLGAVLLLCLQNASTPISAAVAQQSRRPAEPFPRMTKRSPLRRMAAIAHVCTGRCTQRYSRAASVQQRRVDSG